MKGDYPVHNNDLTTHARTRRSLILGRFTNALVKSRPLKDIGAEQVR